MTCLTGVHVLWDMTYRICLTGGHVLVEDFVKIIRLYIYLPTCLCKCPAIHFVYRLCLFGRACLI